MRDKIVGAARRTVKAATSPGSATSHSLSTLASAARARQDWNVDLYYRRLICEKSPESSGAWLQYGHTLKETGFHKRAEDAYNRALALKPLDPEIILQLGHLSKIMGRTRAATAFFQEARRLDHPDQEGIVFELGLLKKTDNSQIFWDAPHGTEREGLHVFLSVAVGRIAENDKSAVGASLGESDYSYAFAMRGFLQALEALGIDHSVIHHPEYIADIQARSGAAHNIHLGFYPPEGMRLLKGAYNIDCCAWEFDRLRTPAEQTSYHAFADPVTMLNIADEIWAPSQAGVDAITLSGVTRPVRLVSAPMLENLATQPRSPTRTWAQIDKVASRVGIGPWQPMAIVPAIQPSLNLAAASRRSSLRAVVQNSDAPQPPKIFLSVFNIHDMRKNAKAMVDAFMAVSVDHPDALLLLKMSTPHRGGEPLNQIFMKEQLFTPGDMVPPVVSERIWVTDQVLTREELNNLYDLSDFYLCTSYGEGQNLPLIEAMSRGVVPVSVDHTAMADYIREDNAIVIPSRKGALDRKLTARYGLYGATTHYCSSDDVAAAMEQAIALGDEAYGDLSRAAIRTVGETFGAGSFDSALKDVVGRMAAGAEA
ncbi:glycosyltransferase [Brevundimonas sp.]|uniref:glycosyltransferase n=1 Tax=Brevundimonas sp. TaxID=1871086 RepID=UPI003D13D718